MRKHDREDIKPKVQPREVALLVDQVTSELLAIEPHQKATVGVVDIPSCMIATYTGQSVSGSAPYTLQLPAYPIKLPMDMGVWSISPEPSGAAYIPIKTDFWDLLGAEDEGLLENQKGFYVEGRNIIFTSQPTSTVKVKLLIVDPSLLSEFDPYPIPADMEKKVIDAVLALLIPIGLQPEKAKA